MKSAPPEQVAATDTKEKKKGLKSKSHQSIMNRKSFKGDAALKKITIMIFIKANADNHRWMKEEGEEEVEVVEEGA